MAIVNVDSLPQVALGFMNEDHREEARLLNELGDALSAFRRDRGDDAAVLERLAAFEAHTRAHFVREEAAMRRAGFAPYPVHKAEHDHVLAELEIETRRFRERGEAERLWAYVSQAIPAWLVGHIESMDYVTARFLAFCDAGAAVRAAAGARARS